MSLLFLGVCAVNGLLYVVGGDDGSCNLASVEYYNPVTDKWTLLPTNMSTGRSYAGKQTSGRTGNSGPSGSQMSSQQPLLTQGASINKTVLLPDCLVSFFFFF